MEWISVKDRYPENGQFVKIKIWDEISNSECVVNAIHKDYPDFRGWAIRLEDHEGRKLIQKPTHWTPDKPQELCE